jgi:hypothetical protein
MGMVASVGMDSFAECVMMGGSGKFEEEKKEFTTEVAEGRRGNGDVGRR